MALDNLPELKVLTFAGDLLPLLEKFEALLTTLSLEGFFLSVDILAIIESCPNLEILLLNLWCGKPSNSIEQQRNALNQNLVLRKLEKLFIEY